MIGLILFSILILFKSEIIICEIPVSSHPDFVQNDGSHFRKLNYFLHNTLLPFSLDFKAKWEFLSGVLEKVTRKDWNWLIYMETK